MKNHRFCTGQRILVGEREYVVERELDDGILQLRDEATSTYVQRSTESLLNIFSKGELRFLHDPHTESFAKKKMGQLCDAEISHLPPKVNTELERRYAYVRRVIKKGNIPKTVVALDPIVKEISKQIEDQKPPSAIQVYRWISDYKRSGESIRSLIPMYVNRGNKNSRFTQEELEIINSKINEKYMTPQRNSISNVHSAIVAEMGRQNKMRFEMEKLRYPSLKTVCNYVNKLDPYEVMKARYGKLVANLKYRPSQKKPQPTRPLERVEIDHTKLDLFVVDTERKMPIGAHG